MSIDITQVFVFCKTVGTGNEAAVLVHAPGAFTSADMESIARQRGAPVTAFVERGPRWRVRFFAPSQELPYCGHGILAVGHVLMANGAATQVEVQTSKGTVCVRRHEDTVTATSVGAPRLEPVTDPEPVLNCLGITPDQLDHAFPIVVASVGSPKWLVSLRARRDLYAIEPRFERLAELGVRCGVNGAYPFTTDTVDPRADAHARGFNPSSGANEDRATGVAAGALAWQLARRSPKTEFLIEQGLALGPLNEITVRLGDATTEIGGVVRTGTKSAFTWGVL